MFKHESIYFEENIAHRTLCLFGMCILRTRQTLKTRQNFKKVPQKKIKNNDTSEIFNSIFFPILNENGKNRALNENVCSILLFFMNTIKSLSPFTDQEYAHCCNILYCLVCLVLKMQMSVLCALVNNSLRLCILVRSMF